MCYWSGWSGSHSRSQRCLWAVPSLYSCSPHLLSECVCKEEGLRIAPEKLQASYHIKPNDSNNPMYFQIFPTGQEGQNILLIFSGWAAQGTVAEHTSRETQHTHTLTFCGIDRFHGCAISFVFITIANSTRTTFVESAFFFFWEGESDTTE